MYLVSVILPVFNGEKYLNVCLDSICKQTLSNIEIICVNDGSTDNTLSILEKYSSKDQRIKIISTENNGQGSARNIALNYASGEYIAFVDADDWISNDALYLLYNDAKSRNLDMLFYQMINYMEYSGDYVETDLYNHICFEKNGIGEETIFNNNNTKDFLFEIPVCPVSKLYRKKFLDEYGLNFSEGMFFEDNEFFYKTYFKCQKAGFLKKHLYYRRRHKDSVTQIIDKRKFDIICAANNILNIFKANDKYEEYKKDVINHTFLMIVEWFKKFSLDLRQSFYKNIKENFKGFNEYCMDFKNNLEYENKVIHDFVVNNDYYLDFLLEYKLFKSEYIIYDGGGESIGGTVDYKNYKDSSSNKYKITIVIPIYNIGKYIHRTLMSIENQSFGVENIEVLLVDDASTDDTYDVLKYYSNKYGGFKVIHIINGSGSCGIPRNIGLLEASSDYVLFLDHDDLLEINALEILYDTIQNYNCDFVYGTYASVDVNLPTKIIYPNEKQGFFNGLSDNERSIAFPPPSIWTKLFKKDFLIKNNILFPTILGEDAIFMSKSLMKAKGVYYLGNSLICYHVLSDSSYTKNISFKYLLEGFASEEYLSDLYNSYENADLYKIRSEGILDFYLSQFYKSNLTKNEIINIFPALYRFTHRIYSLGLSPHVSEHNKILFDYILDKDISSILKYKNVNIEVPRKQKLKNFVKHNIKKVIR